jgi:hypothetical protein
MMSPSVVAASRASRSEHEFATGVVQSDALANPSAFVSTVNVVAAPAGEANNDNNTAEPTAPPANNADPPTAPERRNTPRRFEISSTETGEIISSNL